MFTHTAYDDFRVIRSQMTGDGSHTTERVVPYAIPGSEELADRLESFLPRHDAFLLANHGATTIGPTLTIAHQRMESLEHTAQILLTARLVGRVNALDAAQVSALVAARRRAFPEAVFPGCMVPMASSRSNV